MGRFLTVSDRDMYVDIVLLKNKTISFSNRDKHT